MKWFYITAFACTLALMAAPFWLLEAQDQLASVQVFGHLGARRAVLLIGEDPLR